MPSLDARLLIADLSAGDRARFEEATLVISEIDCNTDIDLSPFVESLSADNVGVVLWCEIALEHLGVRAGPAIPALLPLLSREPVSLRQAAVKTLARIGPRDATAREAIFRAFGDSNPFVRREALQACIGLPDHSTHELAAISAMAADPDETVSTWSEIALRNIRLRDRPLA
jgi:HEAT repeat protein